MVQTAEMKLSLPMRLSDNTVSTTTIVWEILVASKKGNLKRVKELVGGFPDLAYAQYNYTPPIYFAVREGHIKLVEYLLSLGALDPTYKNYPFGETMLTIAEERHHKEVVHLLKDYLADPGKCRFKGDNGEIYYKRTDLQVEFEEAVDKGSLEKTERILSEHPGFAKDQTYFWGEGILVFAAKKNNRPMIDLLLRYGAKVPDILKWAQFYYFETIDGATYMMENGMNPNVMSWHHVTLLHDMSQKGSIEKAELLLKYGANLNPVDEEYQTTPLGMAARWGHVEMVSFLLKKGAEIKKAGASWSTPLAFATKNQDDRMVELLRNAGAA